MTCRRTRHQGPQKVGGSGRKSCRPRNICRPTSSHDPRFSKKLEPSGGFPNHDSGEKSARGQKKRRFPKKPRNPEKTGQTPKKPPPGREKPKNVAEGKKVTFFPSGTLRKAPGPREGRPRIDNSQSFLFPSNHGRFRFCHCGFTYLGRQNYVFS